MKLKTEQENGGQENQASGRKSFTRRTDAPSVRFFWASSDGRGVHPTLHVGELLPLA